MSDGNFAARPKARKEDARKPFAQMTGQEKLVHVLQIVVCICTFGFVYPNALG